MGVQKVLSRKTQDLRFRRIPLAVWRTAAGAEGGSRDRFGGYFGLQVEKRGSRLGGEKQLDSGQNVIVEPTGFADGLDVEWREGKANGRPQAFSLSHGVLSSEMGELLEQELEGQVLAPGHRQVTTTWKRRDMGLGQRGLAWG